MGRPGRKGSQVGSKAAGPTAQHSGAQSTLAWRQCPYLCHVRPVATAPSVTRVYQQETLAGVGEQARITATWKVLGREAPTLTTGGTIYAKLGKKAVKCRGTRTGSGSPCQAGSQTLGPGNRLPRPTGGRRGLRESARPPPGYRKCSKPPRRPKIPTAGSPQSCPRGGGAGAAPPPPTAAPPRRPAPPRGPLDSPPIRPGPPRPRASRPPGQPAWPSLTCPDRPTSPHSAAASPGPGSLAGVLPALSAAGAGRGAGPTAKHHARAPPRPALSLVA